MCEKAHMHVSDSSTHYQTPVITMVTITNTWLCYDTIMTLKIMTVI